MCFNIFSQWFPRLKLQQQDVQRCPRPLHTRDGVSDAQDTCPMDMSPIAKAWQQNPPPEVPMDSQPPKRFARPISSVEIFPDPSASLHDSGPEAKTSIGEEEKGKDGCPSQDPAKSTPPPASATDLFHANEMVTRQEQFAEKEALEKESRKKKASEGDNPEEGPLNTAQKKAQKRKELAAQKKEEKERVKAQKAAEKAAKKATEKAKANMEKAKANMQKKKATAKAEPKKKAAAAKKPSKSGAKRKAKDQNKVDQDTAEATEVSPAAPSQDVPMECPDVPAADGASSTAAVAGDVGEAGRKSWAGRYRPANHAKGYRWDAIKNVFTQQLSSRLTTLSSMEAQCWNPPVLKATRTCKNG